MEFQQWDRLLYGIGQKQCILFLGPELPQVAESGEQVFPTEDLAERLCLQIGEDCGSLEERSLAQIAQRILAMEDESLLEMEVLRWHKSYRNQSSPLHDDLASLPFHWIVTSAHDPLMEAALERADKTPQVERYHYRGQNKELLPEPTEEEPVLFYLYGHIAEPHSLVLSETQLLDFLTGLISRDPPLPNDLNAALSTERDFLFLGFGLQHWYLRILLHVLKVLRRGTRTFAFEPPITGQGAKSAVLFYEENFKVEVHEEDVATFVQELKSRFAESSFQDTQESSGAESGTGSRTQANRGAKIFVCHASEDAEKAEEIHDALQKAGLEPWIDKQSLRGGERWDDQIETTIQKVDYFVVLNSRALATKAQGRAYVVKEINLALQEEQKSFGSYIIPAKIDDVPLLEPLADFQAVDLTADGGLRKLVREIKRQAHKLAEARAG